MASDDAATVRRSDKSLTEIPKDVLLKCDEVRILDLSGNPGIRLKNDLRTFKNVTKLELARCTLQEIPDEIHELTQLEELDLSYNAISKGLNPALGQLSKLKRLTLDECDLTSLPPWIGDLKMLEELSLFSNNLSGGLHDAIGQLQGLKKLQLHYCQLKCLPDSLGDLELLEELNLFSNKFSGGLNPTIGRLRRLKKLVLQQCQLTSLPDSLENLDMLEELNLSDNPLSNGLNPAIGKLRHLKRLYLEGCQLKSLPPSLCELEQLEELYLTSNIGLVPTIGQLRRLRKLELQECQLTSLPDSLGDLEMLEELNCQRSNFSRGLNPAIGRLRRLKKLELQQCQLSSVPESLKNLELLEILNLTQNCLEEYPQCTLLLKNLRELDISNYDSDTGNRIKILPTNLAFTKLAELKLEGNPIAELPKEVWSQGIVAIKSFLRAVIPGGELVHADTLNMIGDAGAGKTSLARSLIARSPQPTAEANRTHVLQRRRMKIDEESGRSVLINDFGGHEIYNSLIPIFLPPSGLLILVYDMSDDGQEQKVKKWILSAIAKCKEIRMIIVGTHSDHPQISKQQRSALEERMRTISSEVLRSALVEVGTITEDLERRSEINGARDKLNDLRQLGQNLRGAAIDVVTLSCSVADEGLSRLHDIIVKELRPPTVLPVCWCRVVNEIMKERLERLYIEVKEIEDICRTHLTDADDNAALKTILRYLANTSQILWFENHPRLHSVVFYSPQKIIDVCRKIFHHNNEVLNSLVPRYETEVEQYKTGILTEPFLLQLLSAHTTNIDESHEQGIPESRHSQQCDVVMDFLQQFNLITQVTTDSKGKRFIVPSMLTSAEPLRSGMLEEMANVCLNRVTLRLSFLGSIIPLALFETSLSSILNAAGELAPHVACLDVWKDGIIIHHGRVFLLAKRIDGALVITAFSKLSDPSPWTVLRPVLKHLSDNLNRSWHGVSPRCAVACPYCARHLQQNEQGSHVGEIEVNLTTLVTTEEHTQATPTCQNCLKTIPRSLCFPTMPTGSSANHQKEIEKFFQNTGDPEQNKPQATDIIGTAAEESQEIVNFEAQLAANMRKINSDIGISSYFFRANYDLVVHPRFRQDAEPLSKCLLNLVKEHDVEGVVKVVVDENPMFAIFCRRLVAGRREQNLGMYIQENDSIFWLSTAHGLAENTALLDGQDVAKQLHVGDIRPVSIDSPGVGGFRMPTPYVDFSVQPTRLRNNQWLYYIVDIMVGPTIQLCNRLQLNGEFPFMDIRSQEDNNSTEWHRASIMTLPMEPGMNGRYKELDDLNGIEVVSYSWVTSQPLKGRVVSHRCNATEFRFEETIPTGNFLSSAINIECVGDIVPQQGHSGCVWARRTSDDGYEAIALTSAISSAEKLWIASPLWWSLLAVRDLYPKIFPAEGCFEGYGLFIPRFQREP